MIAKFKLVVSFTAMALTVGCVTKAAEPVTVEKIQTISATVEAIDLKNRTVSLRPAEGDVATIEVPPEARNLAQVKVGDKVVVKYYQSIDAALRPKGTPVPSAAAEQTLAAGRAAHGEKPAAVAGSMVSTTVTVQTVDKKTNTVTFAGPDGFVRSRQVKDPAAQKFIATLKKGDQVDVTYAEAVAVSVETPK